MKSHHIKSPSRQAANKITAVQHSAETKRGDIGGGDANSKARWSWTQFWFTPVDPVGLHVIRFLLGLLLLFWLLTFWGHQHSLFGLNGWFDVQAYQEAARLPTGPPAPFTWSILYLSGGNPFLLQVLYGLSVGVVLLFTLGVAPRITSVLTWMVVVSFVANPAISYGADYLLVLPAFYVMIGYLFLGQWSRTPSVLERIFGPWDALIGARFFLGAEETSENSFSHAANLALRLFQVHFALVVFVSGLHKLQMSDWWSGVAFWYPLHPPLVTSFENIRTDYPTASFYLVCMSLIQYAVLTWQLTFPMFAWRKRWRPLLLGGAVVGWLGCYFVLGLPGFGPIYFVSCLSFLTAEEWRWAFRLFDRLPRQRSLPDNTAVAANRKKVRVQA